MTARTPRASVLIPAYNAAQHIGGAIRSALEQREPDLEVLVIDDGSSDATVSTVERWAERDARVRLLRTPRNLGPGAARNLGLDAASGDWIALLDADDRFRPGRLERLIQLADEHGADMVADNLELCEPGAGAAQPMLPRALLDAPRPVSAADYLEGNLPVRDQPRVSFGFLKPVIRRSFLEAHEIRYDGELRFAEDFAFVLACLMRGATLWLAPEVGYRYSVRPDSLTSNHDAEDLHRLLQVDRRVLGEPTVQSSPDLAAALQRHARSIEDRLCWRLFTDAVKRRDYGDAATVVASSPANAVHIFKETVIVLPRAMRRIGRRGH